MATSKRKATGRRGAASVAAGGADEAQGADGGADDADGGMDGGMESSGRLPAQRRQFDFPATLDVSGYSATQLQAMLWMATPSGSRMPSTWDAFARSIGVGRRTLFGWRNLPGWNEAVAEIARHNLARHLPDVYGSTVAEAKAGNIKAQRLLYEMLGLVGGENAPTVSTTIQLAIVSDHDSGARGEPSRRLTASAGADGDGDGE